MKMGPRIVGIASITCGRQDFLDEPGHSGLWDEKPDDSQAGGSPPEAQALGGQIGGVDDAPGSTGGLATRHHTPGDAMPGKVRP